MGDIGEMLARHGAALAVGARAHRLAPVVREQLQELEARFVLVGERGVLRLVVRGGRAVQLELELLRDTREMHGRCRGDAGEM